MYLPGGYVEQYSYRRTKTLQILLSGLDWKQTSKNEAGISELSFRAITIVVGQKRNIYYTGNSCLFGKQHFYFTDTNKSDRSERQQLMCVRCTTFFELSSFLENFSLCYNIEVYLPLVNKSEITISVVPGAILNVCMRRTRLRIINVSVRTVRLNQCGGRDYHVGITSNPGTCEQYFIWYVGWNH